jgi:hypothetical protein
MDIYGRCARDVFSKDDSGRGYVYFLRVLSGESPESVQLENVKTESV